MNARIKLQLAKFDKLSVRERALIYGAATVIVVLIADSLFLSPLTTRRASMAATVADQRAEIENVDSQLAELRQRKNTDPDAAAKGRIKEIEASMAAVDAGLKGVQTHLLPPEKMADLLEELVRKNRRLQLVSLKTMPASALIERQPLVEQPAELPAVDGEKLKPDLPAPAARAVPKLRPATPTRAAEETADANIFKHGVEVTVRGSYGDFVDYLTQLEKLPWRMYWGELRIDAAGYPQATMVLVLYTLSLDQAWLTL